jgi:hypothetical protein
MLFPPIIGQEGGGIDWLTLLLPIVVCLMCMSQSQGGGGERSDGTLSESWYTPEDMEKAYEAIVLEAAEWRREHETGKAEASASLTSRVRQVLGGGRAESRFVVKDEVPPKLYSMSDRTGPIYFELTEVEDGGTVVKATYGSAFKPRLARFKAKQPLKIPANPTGKRCPSCGKPVLGEFSVCPYCGERLLEE